MTQQQNLPRKDTVYFSDGVAIGEHVAVFSAGFLAAPEAATSRIYLLFGDFWAAHDVPHDFILSLTYSRALGKLLALGRNGLVKYVGGPGIDFTFDNIRGQFQEHQIEAVEDRGDMERIRAVGNRVYACGWAGQLYEFDGRQWTDRTLEINDPGADFLDICGTCSDDLYVVGMNGVMYHFNGTSWIRVDLPTNCHLFSAHCRAPDNVVLCGSKGLLMQGRGLGWSFIAPEDRRTNFWSVVDYNDDLFITHANTGLLRFDGSQYLEVVMFEKRKPTTYRLSASPNRLLSIGAYDLNSFDGSAWARLSCPDNV